MRHALTASLIAALLAILGGCGQMGPLYMPPEDKAGTAAQPDQSQQDAETS